MLNIYGELVLRLA